MSRHHHIGQAEVSIPNFVFPPVSEVKWIHKISKAFITLGIPGTRMARIRPSSPLMPFYLLRQKVLHALEQTAPEQRFQMVFR